MTTPDANRARPPATDPTHEQVAETIAGLRGREAAEIIPGMRLRDLGLDSLDMVQLAVAVERAFGVEIPDSALVGFDRVADLTAHLRAARF